MRFFLLLMLLLPSFPGASLPDPFSREGYLAATGVSLLHASGYDGTGVRVGIVDNGVDLSRFSASIMQKEFTDMDHPSSKTHGTPVMGMITEGTYASAPDATLFSAALGGDPFDQGLYTNGSMIRLGFEWLIEQDVDIISVSWTGSVQEWKDIIPQLEKKGIFIVGAVGNTGELQMEPSPANTPYGISVGAMNRSYRIAEFSAKGPYGYGSRDFMSKPDVVALGDGVESLSVGFGTSEFSGTSFSAPYVAGTIASLLEALNTMGINWTVEAVKAALMASATDLGELSQMQGAGLINASRALDLLKNAPLVNGTPIIEYVSNWIVPFPKKGIHVPIQLIGTSTILSTDFEIVDSPLPFVLPELEVGTHTLWINTTLENHAIAIEIEDQFVLEVNLSRDIPDWFDGWTERAFIPYAIHPDLGFTPDLRMSDRIVDEVPTLVVGIPPGLNSSGRMVDDPVIFTNITHFEDLDAMEVGTYPVIETDLFVPHGLYGNLTTSKDGGQTLIAGTALFPYAFRNGSFISTIDDGWLNYNNKPFFNRVMQELLQSHVDLAVEISNDSIELNASNGQLQVIHNGHETVFENGSVKLKKLEGLYTVRAVNGTRYEQLEFRVDVSAPTISTQNRTFNWGEVRLVFNGSDFDTVEVHGDGKPIVFFLEKGNLSVITIPEVNAKILKVTLRDNAGNFRTFSFQAIIIFSSNTSIEDNSTVSFVNPPTKNESIPPLTMILSFVFAFICLLIFMRKIKN